jgi:hypothetical protein
MGTSIGVGAGIGAASGFTASRLAEYNTKGTVVLTASGLLIGGALGALLHKDRDPDRSQVPAHLLNGKPPSFKETETDVLFVPDSIQDGKYIEGHRIWTLSPSHWQLEPGENEGEEKTPISKEEEVKKNGSRNIESQSEPKKPNKSQQ